MAASNITSPVADSSIYEVMYDEERFPGTIDVSYMFTNCPGSKRAHVDPTVYIDFAVMKKCFIPGDLSRNIEEITQMYSRVQSNEPSTPMIIFEIAVIAFLLFLYLYSKLSHRHRMRIYENTKLSNLSKIVNEDSDK